MNYQQITSSINNKKLQTIYFLTGDESYYIDQITNKFANNILTQDEKEFNLTILYGKDIDAENIISEAKQFPFNSNKRVLIIKEAQHIKNIELLDTYIKNPQQDTILVIAYKNKTIDKRKKFWKYVQKECILFEGKKPYENKVPEWIIYYLKEKGYQIENDAAEILTENMGNNLSKISNELDKLMLIVNKNEKINTNIIEKHVGISKDYNLFELQNALANKNILKTNKIIKNFSYNTNNYHIIPIISSMFFFFQKIITIHFLNTNDKNTISKAIKVNPFFVKQYQEAKKKYSKKQLFYIFKLLKEYDLKSKGVNNRSTNQSELLKELVFKILHA